MTTFYQDNLQIETKTNVPAHAKPSANKIIKLAKLGSPLLRKSDASLIHKFEQDHLNHINTIKDSITERITNLCLSHQNNNKWFLVIDNQEQTISALNKQSNIDKSKILHINSRKIKINANNIETALSKGNCSAVVLMENNLPAEQLLHLKNCAKQTNTTFMVLDKVSGLH
ncbi:MAG: hypothetical protein ACSHW0_08850 [Thalassotalea sp.]